MIRGRDGGVVEKLEEFENAGRLPMVEYVSFTARSLGSGTGVDGEDMLKMLVFCDNIAEAGMDLAKDTLCGV